MSVRVCVGLYGSVRQVMGSGDLLERILSGSPARVKFCSLINPPLNPLRREGTLSMRHLLFRLIYRLKEIFICIFTNFGSQHISFFRVIPKMNA